MSGWTREWGWNGADGNGNVAPRGVRDGQGMVRSRSKSEAELSMPKSRLVPAPDPSSSSGLKAPKSALPHFVKKPPHHLSNMKRRENVLTIPNSPSSSNLNPAEERWLYKGKGELVDMDIVIVGDGLGKTGGEKERRFEILSPERSFALYAGKTIDPPLGVGLNCVISSDRTRARPMERCNQTSQSLPLGYSEYYPPKFHPHLVVLDEPPPPISPSSALSAERRTA